VDLSTLANIATALTVLTAVIFGLIEARHLRRDREERAALEAVHAMLTPAYMESFLLIQTSLPENASPAEVESNLDTLRAARSIGIVIEGLGYSVFERIVPLRIVDNLVGGNIRVIWRKLRRYVEFERERSGSQKTFEWFQWLAEQLERYQQGKTSLQIGAHQAYRDWKA
jgi:hypothetical protein